MAGFSLTVALAQIAPVWLDRAATLAKVKSYVERAARQGCGLVAFGEALVPGYPFWLELTDGARFNPPPEDDLRRVRVPSGSTGVGTS